MCVYVRRGYNPNRVAREDLAKKSGLEGVRSKLCGFPGRHSRQREAVQAHLV